MPETKSKKIRHERFTETDSRAFFFVSPRESIRNVFDDEDVENADDHFVDSSDQNADNAYCATGEGGGVDPSCSPEKSIPLKTKGAVLQTGTGGAPEGFFIKTPGGASQSGYLYNADFEKEPSSSTRGELFYAEVPKELRRKGIGGSLARDALAAMKFYGSKTVNIHPTSDEGRALVSSLLRAGEISGPIRTSSLGKSEYWIGRHELASNSDEHDDLKLLETSENVFCPTGDGGGIDPTCSPRTGGQGITTIYKRRAGDVLRAVAQDKNGVWKFSDGSSPEHLQKIGIPPQRLKDGEPNPKAWKYVYANPDPNGDVLAEGQDVKGRSQRRYGKTHNAKTSAAKFGRVRELRKKRAVVFKELERDSKDLKLRENADALRVVMQTGIRPGDGSDKAVADFKSYGAVTLEGRHVVPARGGVELRFVTGKSKGKEKTFIVSDPKTVAMLRERSALAGPDGKLFSTDAASLRSYSKSKDGGGFKSKDHRTALGTEIAESLVKPLERAASEKDYKRIVKEIATQVSERLGNTPAMALGYYIDPQVFMAIRPKEAKHAA
jgi:DNA topoisomerase I